ncbi:hypothetical protein [Paenibacillus cellulositrophicus]|uniref:hypothetical protein n=1 Tax=Paenibacillus cellulositrophicus TaxID=562959 RepID=UPI001AD6A7DE|nr:hypothetical protein [Paenibacillus cellulositrophicus]
MIIVSRYTIALHILTWLAFWVEKDEPRRAAHQRGSEKRKPGTASGSEMPNDRRIRVIGKGNRSQEPSEEAGLPFE